MKSLAKIGLVVGMLGGAFALSSVVKADPSIAKGSDLHVQVVADFGHVQQIQALARAEKDVIKLTCVNNVLVQLNPQVNLADTANTALASGGGSSALGQLQTAANEVHALREAADACIGRRGIAGEGSTNSYTTPDGAGDPSDPTTNENGTTVYEPPNYASPTTPNKPRR